MAGPTGVSVIETKLPSTDFAARADHHGPFDQVGRAGKLVWVLLKEAGRVVRVRGILATHGHLDPKGEEDCVKVLRPQALPACIRWFRRELEPEVAFRVALYLRDRSLAG